tara:strand:+ start:2814 stop:3803 length:990 start_codon:yes stop_codon:yes gene_type:complete
VAYNILSGTVLAAQEYIPGDLIVGNIVSGNLSTSDAASVINVPRISNATNNAVVTNVAGDANDLTCETNLTFDGSTLDITGDLTASVGISAPYYWGDGSLLTGIGASSVSGSTRHYSATGFETSGYLKVSGSTTLGDDLTITGDIIPAAGSTYNLGSADNPWSALYIDGSTIYMGTDTLTVADDNLKFGSGSTTKGFDVGFMNFKNNGIFMDPGRLFKLRAYQIQMFGGIGYVRKVVADDYTIQETDYLIGIQSDSLTSSITLTLPPATNLLNGQAYVIKDEGGAVNSYFVTITCSAADIIDGQNEVLLQSPYASIQIYCNGVGKFFVY